MQIFDWRHNPAHGEGNALHFALLCALQYMPKVFLWYTEFTLFSVHAWNLGFRDWSLHTLFDWKSHVFQTQGSGQRFNENLAVVAVWPNCVTTQGNVPFQWNALCTRKFTDTAHSYKCKHIPKSDSVSSWSRTWPWQTTLKSRFRLLFAVFRPERSKQLCCCGKDSFSPPVPDKHGESCGRNSSTRQIASIQDKICFRKWNRTGVWRLQMVII